VELRKSSRQDGFLNARARRGREAEDWKDVIRTGVQSFHMHYFHLYMCMLLVQNSFDRSILL
jgi:hypothetical protein